MPTSACAGAHWWIKSMDCGSRNWRMWSKHLEPARTPMIRLSSYRTGALNASTARKWRKPMMTSSKPTASPAIDGYESKVQSQKDDRGPIVWDAYYRRHVLVGGGGATG